MQEGYTQSTAAVPETQRQKYVLGACGAIENEQEYTAKILEELEAALQGVLSASRPEAEGAMAKDSQSMPPLASALAGMASRQSQFNNRLRSIIQRLEV